ncbi:MAG: thiamine pyrophosphate-dependent enzyme, partial [Pseudomonadota bacterium]
MDTTASTLTAGELLVKSLEALGATRAFGVPGESYLAVLDALHDSPLDLTLTRHEGGAAFMACAWGQLTGAPGICMVTRGPGATNASIGVHSAMQGSVPMILFVGQIARWMREREAFQEVDYRAAFGPIAKWVTEIDDAARIPEILARAWRTALSGRPGPVVIALPEDMLVERVPTAPLSAPPVLSEPYPAPEALARARAMLESAERPLAIVGGTGWTSEGRSALARWAGAGQIPTLAAFRFHDLLDHDALGFAGVAGVGMTPAVKQLIAEADVILACNIRFGEMTTDGYTLFDAPRPRQRMIHSHSSDRELGKIYQPDVALHAAPGPVMAALGDLAAEPGPWMEEARAGYLASLTAPPQPGTLDMRAVVEVLQETLSSDAILTNGAGNFAVWTNRFFGFGPGQRLLAPQSGAMGYGIPAAIAAKIAHPERQVVCIAGDGDFQMTCNELGAAMQAGACPVILVVNNGSYGTIRMHQEREYPARVSGTALENPDFVALAGAYGFHGARVARTAEFAPALADALASPTGAVIELELGVEALTPGATL